MTSEITRNFRLRHKVLPRSRRRNDAGNPLKLRPWQRDIIASIYDQPTRRAIISMGRKNGKSTLAAVLVLAHYADRWRGEIADLFRRTVERPGGAHLRSCAKMIRMSTRRCNQIMTIRDAAKNWSMGACGTTYRALAAEASTAFGGRPYSSCMTSSARCVARDRSYTRR